LSASALTAS